MPDATRPTCDGVAIVDRGNVIRQAPISELLAGTSVVLQVDCSEPDRAKTPLAATNLATTIDLEPGGLAITLPEGTTRDVVAELARVLVTEGIAVYRLIATRFMALRRRRGLMLTLAAVTTGFPTALLAVRLLLRGEEPRPTGRLADTASALAYRPGCSTRSGSSSRPPSAAPPDQST